MAFKTLYQQGVNVFLELGPQPVLAGMGAACLTAEESVAWMPSLIPGKHGASVVQHSLTELHVRRVPINWTGYFEPFGCCERVELPTYAFQRVRFPPLREMGAKYLHTNGVSHVKQQHQVRADVDRLAFEICWH